MFYYYKVNYCSDIKEKTEDGFLFARDLKDAIDKIYADFGEGNVFKLQLEEACTEGDTTISLGEIKDLLNNYGYDVVKRNDVAVCENKADDLPKMVEASAQNAVVDPLEKAKENLETAIKGYKNSHYNPYNFPLDY